MKIAVFCSANAHIAQEYIDAADELGRWIGTQGHTLVYGGQDRGLMRTVGSAVHRHGGRIIGVIPRILVEQGQRPDYLDVEIPCESLSDRKDIMLAQADCCVALPGGIGTLDEVFTVAAAHTIGYHHKPLYLFNTGGFWDKLIAVLDDMQDKGFIRGHWTDYIRVITSVDEIDVNE